MRLGYGKLGRSIPLTLEDSSNVGGDAEVVRLLDILLEEGHEVHLVGRNRSATHRPRPGLFNHWAPGGAFENPPEASRKRDSAFDAYDAFLDDGASRLRALELDACIFWLGQHGSSLHPVPAVQASKIGTYTNPMVSDVNYGYPIVSVANRLPVAPIWLCPDPRNMIKFRDLWDPNQRNILAQFNTSKNNTFYDERDGRLRNGSTRYVYSGIELLAVSPPDLESFTKHVATPPSRPFGLLVNEGYNNLGTQGRLNVIRSWTKNLVSEVEVFGTWSEKSQQEWGRVITSVPLAEVTNTLRRWRATMTFPATATGWATTKPWEAFAAGCVCMKHPGYDTQGHIYNRKHVVTALGEENGEWLYRLLTPSTTTGLRDRLHDLGSNDAWQRAVTLQWTYLQSSYERLRSGAGMLLDEVLDKALPA